MLKALDIVEEEDFHELPGQARDGILEGLPDVSGLLLIQGFMSRALHIGKRNDLIELESSFQQIAEACVQGDAIYPGRERFGLPDIPEMSENLDENLLKEVFGGRLIISIARTG